MNRRELRKYLIDRAYINTAFVEELQKLDDKYSEQRMEWLNHSLQLIEASRVVKC